MSNDIELTKEEFVVIEKHLTHELNAYGNTERWKSLLKRSICILGNAVEENS